MKLNIRWTRVSIVSIAIAGILSATFIAPILISRVSECRAAQLHPHPASNTEQLEILRAVLKEDFFTSFQPPPMPPEFYERKSIVLIGTSIGICEQTPSGWTAELGCINEWDRQQDNSFVLDEPGIPKKLLQELFAANRVSSIIPDPHNPTVLYRPRETIERLIGSGDRGKQFHALFPHSTYAIEVSRAVLSEDGTHALIHVQLRFFRWEQGVLYYLQRRGNTWRVEKANGPVII